MTIWVNHVTIAAPRNGGLNHTVHPDGAGGTVVDGSAFTPTSGRLLICFVEGGVTSDTPTGWTLPPSGSAVDLTGLYIFVRDPADGTSADQVATTHNSSNYPVVFDFYEFGPDSTFGTSTAATGVSGNGGAGPTLSGLTGTNWTAGIGGVYIGSGGAKTATWNAGVEEVDTSVAFAVTDGYLYSLTYTEDNTASSAAYAMTATAPANFIERLVVALVAVAIPTPTAPIVSLGEDAWAVVGGTFGRIPVEDDTGNPITAREWKVISGPADAGYVVSNDLVSTWKPTVQGSYVIRYTATNGLGSTFDEINLEVGAPVEGPQNSELRR